jgi:CBS-domain-containing membrane protein
MFAPTLQRRGINLAETLKTLTVQDVMTRAVVTVGSGTEVREAARLMHERRIGALPVVDGGKLVGILTETDVLGAFQKLMTEGVIARPYRWAFAWR